MSRIEEIVYDLIKINDFVTTKDLAKIFNVSDRTIRSDLNKVEQILPYYGLSLERKSGVGIKLKGSKSAKDLFVVDNVQQTMTQSDIYSPSGRILYILVELLLQRNTVHIEYLTSQLFVSRSTVQKDLMQIEDWLKERDLLLVRQDNRGLIIEGEETVIRETISDIIMQKDRKLEILSNETIDESLLKQLNKLVGFDIEEIRKIVSNAEKEFGVKFSYDSRNNLVTHIAITIKRIEDSKVIEFPSHLAQEIQESKEFEITEYISKKINEKLNVIIPDEEKYYLAMHIIGASFDDGLMNKLTLEYRGVSIKELTEKITIEFLEIIEKILLIKLSDNERLVDGLTMHLIPTINRIEYDLRLYNPILEDIKKNYSSIFIISWNINLLFDKYLGKTVSEDEIAYITLHVAAAIESTKEKKRVAVVCTSGIGASRLLKVRLEKHFPQFEIITYSDGEVDEYENVDFILSTIPLNTEQPYLVVSTIIDEREIERINKFLNIYNHRSSKELFNIEDIHIINETLSKEDILLRLTKQSILDGDVDEDFLASVYDREMINSTEIGDGVVLTHGFPEFVKRSKIVIGVLKDEIIWNEEYVKVVILQIMSEQDIKDKIYRLDWFYRCLSREDFIEELKKASSPEEVKNLMISEKNA